MVLSCPTGRESLNLPSFWLDARWPCLSIIVEISHPFALGYRHERFASTRSHWPGRVEESRGVLLKPSQRRGSAQVLPIGLPSLPYPTERGNLVANQDTTRLETSTRWPALLAATPRVLGPAGDIAKPVHWRALSVSEQSRNVSADRAFAVRVSWGRDETYVIYRSLAKPAPRAFLGHQTTARLPGGSFTPEGTVEPILKID